MTREDVDDSGETAPFVNGGVDPMEGVEDARDSASPSTTSSEWTGEYTWAIRNFSHIKERKLYSETFEVGTYSWRLLIFPKGNDNARQADHVAVYLDFPEASYTPPHMSPKAHFDLIVENQTHSDKTLIRGTQHTFTSQATDWGFTQFLAFSDANDPKKGFIVDDTLVLKVRITVHRDERYSFLSRKETGFVGLKNQGATCYMNSLLQYLYHLPYFRKAVYHMPTLESDEPERSLPLALQSLFFKLQYSPTSVSTKALTKSFGWGTYDAFMQHDIQEMEAKLCEKLEEKMKGTKVEKVIEYLFVGHYSNHIECVDVDFKSVTRQPFMEIQLEVTGCKDLYASLDKFCEVEKLEHPNKYHAEGHGLVDARKFVKFDDFPPVLQLHLMRFDYDYQRDMQIKINDHYEFYSILDLDIDNRKYLTANADRSVRNLYKLHSVLVHSGGPHGGHYFAFIRPSGDKWYKFDDEMVREETEKRATQEQYGGDDEPFQPTMPAYNSPGLKYAKQSTAYMLVYIRDSDWDNISCRVGKEEIAEHIRTRLEAEQQEKERRQKEKEEAHLYVVIKVACDTDFKSQIGNMHYFDLVNFDQVMSYRIHKRTKFDEFRKKVAEDFGVTPSQQRFWIWKRRHNSTVRPDTPLPPDLCIDTILDLREFKDHPYSTAPEKNALMTVKLYLEMPEAPGRPLNDIPTDSLLLFFKLYNPFKRELSYINHMCVHKREPFRDIFARIAKIIDLPEGTDIIGCEEIKFEPSVLCEEIEDDMTPEKDELMCGDIICLQRRLTDAEARALKHPTVKSFLEYIQNSKSVNFRPLMNPKDEGFKLELLKTMSYDDVCNELAQHLRVDDPRTIRLTQHNMYAHQPHRNPIKYRGADNLEAMIMHVRHYTNILYYEILDMPLPALEKLKCVRIQFHNEKSEYLGEHQIRIPRDSGVEDLLQALKQELGPEYQGKPMRLMEVYHGKIFKVLKYDTTLDHLNETYWQYRAEVIPDDERDPQPDEHMLHVCHFKTEENSTGIATTFGDPFWLRIRQGETLADIKPRLKEKLGVANEDFAKWKFAYSARQMHHPLEYLSDEDDVLSKFPKVPLFSQNDNRYYGGEYCFLGLEHEDTRPRRLAQHSRYTYERPVRIYS